MTRRRALTGAAAICIAAAGGGAIRAQPNPTPLKLVMLGDSLTEGYGLKPSQAVPAVMEANLKAQGMPVRILNAGVSGNTSGDALARFNADVPRDAQGVLIAIGANDMLQLYPPKYLAGNLHAMIERAKSRNLKVALAGMQVPFFIRGSYQEQFDAVYPTLAREFDAPLYPFLLDGVMLNPDLNQDDGIHPNAAGARAIADRLTPFVEDAFDLAHTRTGGVQL